MLVRLSTGRQMMPSSHLHSSYDRRTDVLYISKRPSSSVRGTEDACGIVWKYDRSGVIMAVLVQDLWDRWRNNVETLTNRVSEGINASPDDVEEMIRSAISKHREQ